MTKYRSSLPINDVLKEHAVVVEDWRYRELASLLHEWAGRCNHEFALGIETPAIQIDVTRLRAYGTYRRGRNGFGLRHEVTVNACYLDRPLANVLTTLLHELLHEWQELHGQPGSGRYHNVQFQQKAREYGLVVDQRGCTLGVVSGPFIELLARYGVDASTVLLIPQNGEQRRRGESKMKKWSCGCTNVRAAVELEAECLKCGRMFQEALPAW